MNPLVWLLLGGAGLAAVSYLFKRRQVRHLPTLTDAEFLSIYKEKFPGSDELVLSQRLIIATHLGLPAETLSPIQTFAELSGRTGFVGEYEVGMGDLEDELYELCEFASVTKPSSFPPTIGELIHEMIRAKLKLSEAG